MKKIFTSIIMPIILFSCYFGYIFYNPFFLRLDAKDQIMNNKIVNSSLNIDWNYNSDEIFFRLESPEKGWIAIGFNDMDDIVGSDLFMVSASKEYGESKAEHHYVTGLGKHPKVETLGKRNRLARYSYSINSGINQKQGSSAELAIKIKLDEPSDKRFQKGNQVYLILAYSVDPDFNHHSIYRKHFKITL